MKVRPGIIPSDQAKQYKTNQIDPQKVSGRIVRSPQWDFRPLQVNFQNLARIRRQIEPAVRALSHVADSLVEVL
jgi:hypothetical protein